MLELREGRSVTEALSRACENWSRTEDAWDAITWAIARDPTFGAPISESGDVRAAIFDGAKSMDMPTITVIYKIGNPTVELLYAKFEEPKYGQAGRA